MNEHTSLALMISTCVIAICTASVKGCQSVYNPDSIRADTEQRVQIYKMTKGESHEQQTH